MRILKKTLAVFAVVCLIAIGLTRSTAASDRPEEFLVTIKTYIISGSAGMTGLSFPMFPHMSLAVLEETIPKVEMFYEKLRSLYAFSDYRLVAVSSGTVRLTGYPRPTATIMDRKKEAGPWEVNWQDFNWDKEGRLQMTVKVDKASESFIESHISVLPGRSVILGRFADENMTEAVFAIIVPEIDVAALTETDNVKSTRRIMPAEESQMEMKAGLPPAMPRKVNRDFDCPEGRDTNFAEFIAVSQYPELLYQAAPKYPESAVRERAQGKVWINSMISKEGKVLKCCVLRSSGREDLDQAAIQAAWNYQYRPALDENGDPVTIWVAYQVVFALEE